MKTCTECLKSKPLDQFYRRSRSKDGHATKCIECAKAYKKQFYAENAERIKAEVKAYYAENAEARCAYTRQYYADHVEECRARDVVYREKNRQAINERCRDYRARNSEKVKASQAVYRENNRERRREEFRRWRLENPDKMRLAKTRWKQNNSEKVLESARICGNRRRARKAEVPSIKFTADDLRQRWEYYGHRCYLCRKPANQTDHVKPLGKGGADMLCNLRPICGDCNSRKNDRWPYPPVLGALSEVPVGA